MTRSRRKCQVQPRLDAGPRSPPARPPDLNEGAETILASNSSLNGSRIKGKPSSDQRCYFARLGRPWHTFKVRRVRFIADLNGSILLEFNFLTSFGTRKADMDLILTFDLEGDQVTG